MTAADRPSVKPGPWTSHGHDIPGVTVAGTPRPARARCGGPSLCAQCSREAVAADSPSVTDNARAEAWRRFPNGIDVETGEPVDDYGYPETAREAVPQLIATVREQAAKLARVEALHQPSPEQVDDAGVAYRLCLHCTYINRYGRQRYPCPTITALNEGATK